MYENSVPYSIDCRLSSIVDNIYTDFSCLAMRTNVLVFLFFNTILLKNKYCKKKDKETLINFNVLVVTDPEK